MRPTQFDRRDDFSLALRFLMVTSRFRFAHPGSRMPTIWSRGGRCCMRRKDLRRLNFLLNVVSAASD
jgi:hypothetical protein